MTCTDREMEICEGVRTRMMTRHPAVMEHRGILKLARREPDKRHGFKLIYEGDTDKRNVREIFSKFVRQELKRRSRS